MSEVTEENKQDEIVEKVKLAFVCAYHCSMGLLKGLSVYPKIATNSIFTAVKKVMEALATLVG